MKIKKIFIPLIWSLLLTLVCLTVNAQDIVWGNASQPDYIKHFQVARTLSGTDFAINVTSNPGGLTIRGRTSPGGSFTTFPLALSGGLIANLVGDQIQITGTASSSEVFNIFLELQLESTTSPGDFFYRRYHFVVRRPYDVVFVLDRSGSMGCGYNEDTENNWPACLTSGDTDVRWNVLSSSVRHFLDKWSDATDTARILPNVGLLTGDRVAVMYFSGTTRTCSLTTLTNTASFTSQIQGDMITCGGPPFATDGTSLGLGLKNAINTYFPAGRAGGRRELLYLYTDGEQNTNNWVRAGGDIIQESRTVTTEVMQLQTGDQAPIEISVGGTVKPPAGAWLLQEIAEDAGHFHNVAMFSSPNEVGGELAAEAFDDAFQDASPRTIQKTSLFVPITNAVQTSFVCNKGASRVIIDVFFDQPVANRCTLQVFKNNVLVNKLARFSESDYHTSFIFDLYQNNNNLNSEGSWRVVASSSIPCSIEVRATADDHKVKFSGTLLEKEAVVGEKITPRAMFRFNQAVLSNATIRAIIQKPAFDLGDLIARASTPTLPNPSKESNGCDGQKLEYLLKNNSEFKQKATSSLIDTIELSPNGKGEYLAIYNKLNVTGVHKITYWIQYKAPDGDFIERIDEQTVYVTFDNKAALKSRTVKSSFDPPGGYYSTLNFVPFYTDPQGNEKLIGPGYEGFINIKGVNLSGIVDNCNGNYTLYVVSKEQNPNIIITINNNPVHQGKLLDFEKDVQKPTPTTRLIGFSASLHLGTTIPTNDFGNIVKGGAFGELDLSYRFKNNFDVEAVLGYYGFTQDYQVTGASAHLGYMFGEFANGWLLRGAAGLGIYKPKTVPTTVGYTGRIELGRQFGSNIELSLLGGYVYLADPKWAFFTGGVGLKYFF